MKYNAIPTACLLNTCFFRTIAAGKIKSVYIFNASTLVNKILVNRKSNTYYITINPCKSDIVIKIVKSMSWLKSLVNSECRTLYNNKNHAKK